MTTDTLGNVTYLNAEAEGLTGWTRAEAFARPLAEVFDVTDGLTGQHAQDPSRLAIEHQKKVRLKGNYILVGRDGNETAIEHSAAPIHDRQGNILGAVIVFRDVIVSRERRLQMLHLAEHDALTDLPNRLLLNDRLARSIALARRYGRRLAVLFLDCDRFKHINDTLGHAIGDQVLRSVAKRLTTCVRESDTVSRHGGDEFLILLSEVDHPEDAGADRREDRQLDRRAASRCRPRTAADGQRRHRALSRRRPGRAVADHARRHGDVSREEYRTQPRRLLSLRHGSAGDQTIVDRVGAAERARQGASSSCSTSRRSISRPARSAARKR